MIDKIKDKWHSFWYKRIPTHRDNVVGGPERPNFYTFRSQRLINLVCGIILLIIITHIL